MMFRSYAKNFRILTKTPYQEVQNGIPIQHAGEYIQFERHYYETTDAAKISVLKSHKAFCESPDTPGGFWIYVEPTNYETEYKRVEEENAFLRERLEKLEAATPSPATSKTNKPQSSTV